MVKVKGYILVFIIIFTKKCYNIFKWNLQQKD